MDGGEFHRRVISSVVVAEKENDNGVSRLYRRS
jgi:hypothetical protein